MKLGTTRARYWLGPNFEKILFGWFLRKTAKNHGFWLFSGKLKPGPDGFRPISWVWSTILSWSKPNRPFQARLNTFFGFWFTLVSRTIVFCFYSRVIAIKDRNFTAGKWGQNINLNPLATWLFLTSLGNFLGIYVLIWPSFYLWPTCIGKFGRFHYFSQ